MCILLCGISFGEIQNMQDVFKTQLLNDGIFLLSHLYLILVFKRGYEKCLVIFFPGTYFSTYLFISKYPNHYPDPLY